MDTPEKRNVLIFNEGRLLPGDILLSTDRTDKESAAILWATRSEYSHAAILSDYGNFIEARPPGVCSYSVSKTKIGSLKNIRVLRLSDRSTALQAARNATKSLRADYAKIKAVLSPLKVARFIPETPSVFCSALVARAYSDAGVTLVREKDVNEVSPGDLARSNLLRDVTSRVVISVVAEQLPPMPVRHFVEEGVSNEVVDRVLHNNRRVMSRPLRLLFYLLVKDVPHTPEQAIGVLLESVGRRRFVLDSCLALALHRNSEFDTNRFKEYEKHVDMLRSILDSVARKSDEHARLSLEEKNELLALLRDVSLMRQYFESLIQKFGSMLETCKEDSRAIALLMNEQGNNLKSLRGYSKIVNGRIRVAERLLSGADFSLRMITFFEAKMAEMDAS